MSLDLSSRAVVSRSLNHEILSEEEELALLDQAKRGDNEATEKLIASNQRLIAVVARKYFRHNEVSEIEFCDLMQAGNMGLMKAIQMWDARKKVKFDTYAYYWIRAYVRRLALHRAASLSISYGFSEKLVAIRKARNDLMKRLDREPTAEEIAEETGLPLKEVEIGMTAIAKTIRLYEEDADEFDSRSADIFMPEGNLTDEEQDTEEAALSKALLSHAKREISEMPAHWQIILIHRFGLNGQKEMTQAEIGKMLGMTRQNVDYIEKVALRRIRQNCSLPRLF